MANIPASYETLYKAVTTRSNVSEKAMETFQHISQDDAIRSRFDWMSSCISFGTGSGLVEIEFIKRLMPNLKSFAAVEPDTQSAEQLLVNLERHLPNVKSVVYKQTVEEFLVNYEVSRAGRYDATLLINLIYLLGSDVRKNFCQQLFNGILNSSEDGREPIVIVQRGSRAEHPESLDEIICRLNPKKPWPTSEETEAEFVDAGFAVQYRREFQHWFDYSDPNEDLRKIFAVVAGLDQLEMNHLTSVIRSVWKDMKTENNFREITFLVRTS